ncbi:MAG TPA: CBS domain-containing protein [Bacillus sp. (in: firmicutes)]|uniref:CBS domain-containing protein n=1 Tax=Bacillus litorisediminis TaxID=2922713 RepID=UPI001FAB614B|nr:CBS domain-containing protein [Bacillus litorisediminis]HWO74827.1 CBS domain-containing protein [Bacillus sp. (in: firmicutes)]
MKKVKDLMTKDVAYCTLLDNVYEVAVKMKELNVGAIPIVNNEQQLAGMITDRDIVIRGVAEKHPGSTKVENIMSDKLVTINPDASIDEAIQLMKENQVRRIPVVENKKLVGILALGDVALQPSFDHEAEEALTEISEHTETTYLQ